ncbi:MAG: NAD(+) diphosphatase [Clostridium sp.]|nr:NAD(+) diphosphatase [Clostridium sp.]
MLHEIEPKKFRNAFTNKDSKDSDLALVYREHGIVFVREGDGLRLPYLSELVTKKNVEHRYGYSIDDNSYYIVFGDVEVNADVELYPLRELRYLNPMSLAFAGLIGKQLYRFFQTRQYCGCCGTHTKRSTTEQAVICPKCNHVEYPKISPAIIVAIVNGDKLLMTKYANGDYHKYALVAGFVEFGESFEQAVVREVKEEVGLNVKNVTYFKNQPWPISDSQMVGFFAELDGDETVTLQEEELSEAVWFDKEKIPVNQNAISLGYELVEAVRSGEYKKYL